MSDVKLTPAQRRAIRTCARETPAIVPWSTAEALERRGLVSIDRSTTLAAFCRLTDLGREVIANG